jgi:hypothetical protein
MRFLSDWYRHLGRRWDTHRRPEPVGDPTWFRSEVPVQPRHPMLVAKPEAQAARYRANVKRRAWKLLKDAGFDMGVL